MNNQNSKCCQSKIKYVPVDEGTGYMICTKCGEACGINPTTSKSEERKCGCGHYGDKYLVQGSQCNECFDGFHENCRNNTPPTRLENWEEKLESGFNKNFGFGIWDSRAKNGHRSEGIPSTAVLEWTKSFISTLLQEERGKESKRCMDIFMNYTDPDTTMAVGKKIFNLQQQ